MNDNLLYCIMCFLIAVVIMTVSYFEYNSRVEPARAGLEQCLEGTKILWKKSCK